MSKTLLWKIGGEAGFGIMTTGTLFAKIAMRSGYHIFDYHEYPSLIRGGHNTYEVRLSDEEVYASQTSIDILICLNKATFELHKHRLSTSSIVVYDKTDFEIVANQYVLIDIPFKQILKEEQALLVMLNNIALGVSVGLMGWDFTLLEAMIVENFAKKGDEVITRNKKAAKRGFDHIRTQFTSRIISSFPSSHQEPRLLLTGNDAFCLASVVADCRFYCAYPMTPTSNALTTLATWSGQIGMIVRHAEDEIAVINTALGASWSGVRAAVGTSGGGFALMVETLSFAGVAEIPLVVYLGQRPGPATGMPTWTEQGDLLFAVHAGHGEFPKIVISPGDVEEVYELTAEAFDLADIYQTPVILITDRLLAESHKSTYLNRFTTWSKSYTPSFGKRIVNYTENSSYVRYKLTDDGISPLLTPGLKGYFYQSNSYEHGEDGHTTEESGVRIAQVNKRALKMNTYLTHHFKSPKVIETSDTYTFTFVSWGGNKGSILEAMNVLKTKGIGCRLIHFTHLFPLDEARIRPLFEAKSRYFLIENNSEGQFGKLLREQTGITLKEKLLKYDGRPFYPEEIITYVVNSTKQV